MSEELYKQHRPKSFKAVYGQDKAVNCLQGFLKKGKTPHTLLFTGPSGCGKTTLARIMSSKLGCTDSDLNEINAADFRGIDTIRDIRNHMQLAPLGGGKCRVWIMDECHIMRSEAQNAFLKILEDTPSHVYFMLATTDPNKLIKTIRTRCTCINLQALSSDHIEELINKVCKKEGLELSEDVRDKIVKLSDGSARQALVHLHAVANIHDGDEEKQLEAIEPEKVQKEGIDLARVLINPKSDWKEIANVLKNTTEDPESIRRVVLGYANAVLLNSGSIHAFNIIDCFSHNFYDSTKAGLTGASFMVFKSRQRGRK